METFEQLIKTIDLLSNRDEKVLLDTLGEGSTKIIFSSYQMEESAPISGLNIGCQIYKYSKNIKEKTAIVYAGQANDELTMSDVALAIAIEIYGITNVTVISLSEKGGVVVNGKTFKSIIKKGLKPHLCLKNRESHDILVECADIIPKVELKHISGGIVVAIIH